jgi:transcriptional regulator with XRE-family HTH domain
MNYDKKIKLLRSSLELTQKDFALKLSIPLSTLKKIESGISNGLSAVEQILSNDEFVYLANWFFDPNATDKALSKKGSKSELNRSLSLGHINLPFYEVKASAGDGVLVEAERQTHLISFKPEWLNKEIGVNANDVFLMLVDGDSMYPTLKNGAMIMVNKHFNGLSDGVYVMRHEQNLLVKRLQMLPNGIIKVKSDNALYEPWEINKENLDGTDIEIIGRVVWSGQRM